MSQNRRFGERNILCVGLLDHLVTPGSVVIKVNWLDGSSLGSNCCFECYASRLKVTKYGAEIILFP